jgi:protein subunit release factor A
MMSDLIPLSDDFKVEMYDPHKGGQHVGTPRGVRVEHLPTGTIAIVQSCQSSHRNRIIAQRMILAALTDVYFGR